MPLAATLRQTPGRRMCLTADPPGSIVPIEGGVSNHQLSNPGTEKLVFKVKLSKSPQYKVNPMVGFVEPGASTPLEVTRHNGTMRHQLVIEFGAVPAGAADATAAFNELPMKPSVMLLPLKVPFWHRRYPPVAEVCWI